MNKRKQLTAQTFRIEGEVGQLVKLRNQLNQAAPKMGPDELSKKLDELIQRSKALSKRSQRKIRPLELLGQRSFQGTGNYSEDYIVWTLLALDQSLVVKEKWRSLYRQIHKKMLPPCFPE